MTAVHGALVDTPRMNSLKKNAPGCFTDFSVLVAVVSGEGFNALDAEVINRMIRQPEVTADGCVLAGTDAREVVVDTVAERS